MLSIDISYGAYGIMLSMPGSPVGEVTDEDAQELAGLILGSNAVSRLYGVLDPEAVPQVGVSGMSRTVVYPPE